MTSQKLIVFALAGFFLLTMMAFTPAHVAAYTDTAPSGAINPGQWYYWGDSGELTFTSTWTLTFSVTINSGDPNFDEYLMTAANYNSYQAGNSFDPVVDCTHPNVPAITSMVCTEAAGSYYLVLDNTNAGTAQTNGYADHFYPSLTATQTGGGGMSVSAYATPTSVSAGSLVTFSASATGGTSPYTYTWDFGDSHTGAGASTTHSYSSSGTYYVTVKVTDYNLQIVTSSEITITVTGSVDTSGLGAALFLVCVLPIIIIIIIVVVIIYFVMRRRSPPAYQPPMGQPYQQGPPPGQPYYSQPPPPPMDPYNNPPPPPPYGGGNYSSPPPPPYGSGNTYQNPPPPPYR